MKRILLFKLLFLLATTSLYGQNDCEECNNDISTGPTIDVLVQETSIAILLPQFVSVQLEGDNGTDVLFALNADELSTAGEEFIIDEANCSLWITYSSIANGPSNKKSISVSSSSVSTIPGLIISVCASSHYGKGGGQVGTANTTVIPSSTPAPIITNIGTSFTGKGNSEGHKLTYHLDFTGDFGDLNVEDISTVITMTYTISE